MEQPTVKRPDYRALRMKASKRNKALTDELSALRELGLNALATLRAIEAGAREPDAALIRRMKEVGYELETRP